MCYNASMASIARFEFDFIVNAVKTTVDQGIRIYIDISEGDIETAAILMACKKNGIPLHAMIGTADKQEVKERELMNFNKI
jgi:hypothetical protein